ncbi:MAG: cytochrome c biogenesis CcdA family protein [Candidatus Bipolaricaulia bacterium]
MIRLSLVIGVLLASLIGSPVVADELPSKATVYYNEACGACAHYIRETLQPLLNELGITDVHLKDFINHPEYRRELVSRSEDIPPQMQGHFTVFVGEGLVLQGHVPERMVRTLLEPTVRARYERLVVLQDRMTEGDEKPPNYTVWMSNASPTTYAIDTPVTQYLDEHGQAQSAEGDSSGQAWTHAELLPFVLSTGLLDGVNPCAIAVLLFFIAFMFTLHRTRSDMLLMGGIYISMIYLAYLGIGLGLLGAIVISGVPHLMAKIGAGLLIGLGLINVKDYVWYGRGVSLSLPKSWHAKSFQWLERATLPAAAGAGFLVGLCTFPCSGGIYVAVLGLLSSKTTFWTGFGYMLLYNLMFVAPLIVLLFAMGNRRTVGAVSRWEARHKRTIKLATGAIMIALGSSILVWFA